MPRSSSRAGMRTVRRAPGMGLAREVRREAGSTARQRGSRGGLSGAAAAREGMRRERSRARMVAGAGVWERPGLRMAASGFWESVKRRRLWG